MTDRMTGRPTDRMAGRRTRRTFDDHLDRASGKAKQWAGRAVGDRRLERQGRVQSVLARAKLAMRRIAKDIKQIVRARRTRRRTF